MAEPSTAEARCGRCRSSIRLAADRLPTAPPRGPLRRKRVTRTPRNVRPYIRISWRSPTSRPLADPAGRPSSLAPSGHLVPGSHREPCAAHPPSLVDVDIPALATATAAPRAGARSRQNASLGPKGRLSSPCLVPASPRPDDASAASSSWAGPVLAACWGERRKPQTHQPKEESETCPTTLPSRKSASEPSRPRSGRIRPETTETSATASPSASSTAPPRTASGRPPGAST